MNFYFFHCYLGKLNDKNNTNNNVNVKDVNVKDVSEPNKTPQPISFIIVFVGLYILIKNPAPRQEINIKIIK